MNLAVKKLRRGGLHLRCALAVVFLAACLPLFGQRPEVQWLLVTGGAQGGGGISTADLKVQQDSRTPGVPATVQPYPPYRIGLLFDESGSGRRSPLLDTYIQRVVAWSDALSQRRRSDWFAVGFNDQIVTSTRVTARVSELQEALTQMHPIGGSAIRDAVVHGTQKFYALGPEPTPTGRVILLISDGFDNASTTNERRAIESAQSFGVRVYAISVPGPEAASGRSLLQHLAEATGGQTFFPSNAQELNSALAAIEADLNSSILVGVVPASNDGKSHKVRVTLSDKPLRSVPVFYAPSAQ